MKTTTDNSLDCLIRETIDRRELLNDLNRMIVQDVKRRSRRVWLRRWMRVAAFCFALPLVSLLFFAGIYIYLKEQGFATLSIVIMLPTVSVFIFAANRSIDYFSPDGV